MAAFTGQLRLDVARDAIDAGAATGLRNALEHLLTQANTSVPHDEGTLERSGATDVDTQAKRGSVYYDTPYAARQHEDMDLSHDGKGQAKWLETTLTQEAGTVRKIVQTAIASQMGG